MSAVAARPRFFGILKGEAVKLSRQLSIWLMLAGSVILLAVIVLGITSSDSVRRQLSVDPTGFFFNARDIFGTIFQIGSGIFLLIVGSRLFAMEYSSGTIRIIYARGTGRLRFLLAKMLTMAVVGLLLLAGYLVVAGSLIAVLVDSWAGSLAPIQNLPSEFWHDLGYWALVQGMSMAIAILMVAAATAIGRSLAFAMAASLAFFPVDNFVTILLALGSRITRQDHPWLDITRYLLGPNLNVVLGLIEPGHHARPAFAAPLLPVDGTHALTVIGLYGLAFAVIAVVRTARSDVLE